MTEEEVRAEVGTKAIKFIDEHEKDCLTGFEMMRDFAYEVTKDLEQENADFKNRNAEAKDMIKELYEGLDKLYLSGLSDKQIAFIERLQDKTEQFLKDCDIDNAIQQANKGLDFDKIADEMEQDLKDSEVEK